MNMWIKKWKSSISTDVALGRQDLPLPQDNRIVISESVVLAPDQQLITLGTTVKKSCDKCTVEEEESVINNNGSDRHHDHAVLRIATDQEKEAAVDDHHHHVVLKSDKANSSFLHCVLNMSGMLIGLGQLSTPYALENAGWASSILLIGLGVTCAYTANLLGKCLDKDPTSRSYADIGSQAFGKKGKILACTFIYMEIFMALVSYTISLHDNLNTVFTTTSTPAAFSIPSLHLSSDKLLTTVAVLVALPSLWIRDLSSISFLSTGGILMSVLIFFTVVSTAVFGHVQADHSVPVLNLRKIPHVTGLYVFSFAGHIVFPNIHRAMKDPTQFKKVAIVSFTLVTLHYTAIAFTGAKLFGPTVSSQITLSMPRHHVATKIALWATVLTPMTKYALEFAPFATQLEQRLSAASGRTRTVVRGTVGSVMLLAILGLALTVPYFQYVLGLTGSLVSIGICVVLPCVFYLRVFKGEVTWVGVGVNVGLIVVGGLLGVFGTVSSSRSLIETLMEGGATRGA